MSTSAREISDVPQQVVAPVVPPVVPPVVAPDFARSHAARPSAPWWDDLSESTRRHLALAAYESTALPRVVDVAVVGTGVAGLSAALAAQRSGADVLALDATPRIGLGATGRNAGILSAGLNMMLADLPPGSPLHEMWPATTRVLLDLLAAAREPGAILAATRTGSLCLAERPTALRQLVREANGRTRMGLRAEVWTPMQVAEATDGRLETRTLFGALWLPDEGRIHPLTLLAHLARQARALGVRLVGGARVADYEEITQRGGAHGWRLRLADGRTMEARSLVVATGPTLAPTRRLYAVAFPSTLPDDFPLFWDAAPYVYADYRPGNGRIGVTGGRYGRVGGDSRDAHYHQMLVDTTRHWLPELADVPPSHAWAVDVAVTPDMVPQTRALGKYAPGLAIDGLGVLGVLPGILLGQQSGETLAEQIQ